MAQYTSPLSIDLPHMYLLSKFEESIPCGYLETELNATGAIRNGLKVHPDGSHIIYSVGSSLVIEDASTSRQEVLQGHTDFITCIAVANGSGELLASGQTMQMGFKADIIVWDYNSREEAYRLVLHMGSVQALAFSSNNLYLASLGGPDDGTVVIWNMENGNSICGAPAQAISAGNTLCVAFSKTRDNVFVTAGESTMRIWNLDVDKRIITPEEVKTGQLRRTVTCIEVDDANPAREMFFCGTQTGDILAVNMRTGLMQFRAPLKKLFESGVTALAQINSDTFLVGTGCGNLHKFNFFVGQNTSKITQSWHDPKTKSTRDAAVTSVAVGNNGKFYLGTANGLEYRFSSFDSGELLKNCHTARVNDLDFPSASSQLIVTCQREQVRVWLTRTMKELVRFTTINTTCNSAKVSSDGRFIVTGWDDRVIRVLNGQTMACVAEMIDAHSKGVTAVACKWDCRGIVTGGGEGQVRVWQYTHGMGSSSFKLLAVMKEHKSRVTEIQIRSDDNECVSACEDGTCIIWDLVNYARLRSFFASTVFKCVRYSSDETMIITSGTDRKITFWDVFDANIIRELNGADSGTVNALDVSPDGKYFVSGGEGKMLKVWKCDEGEVVKLGTGLTSEITCVKFSPDGRSVVTAGKDGAICSWKLPNLD